MSEGGPRQSQSRRQPAETLPRVHAPMSCLWDATRHTVVIQAKGEFPGFYPVKERPNKPAGANMSHHRQPYHATPPIIGDDDLRIFTAGVYACMALGLVVSGAIALGVYELAIDETGGARSLTHFGQAIRASPLRWAMLLSPAGVFPLMSGAARKFDLSRISASILFFGFATAMGLFMSNISIAAAGNESLHGIIFSGAQAFWFPAGGYAGLCLHRLMTRREMPAMEIFFVIFLWGLGLQGLSNYFIQWPEQTLNKFTAISLAFFAVFTAANIKSMIIYNELQAVPKARKNPVTGALWLTIAFITSLIEALPLVV